MFLSCLLSADWNNHVGDEQKMSLNYPYDRDSQLRRFELWKQRNTENLLSLPKPKTCKMSKSKLLKLLREVKQQVE